MGETENRRKGKEKKKFEQRKSNEILSVILKHCFIDATIFHMFSKVKAQRNSFFEKLSLLISSQNVFLNHI
jgi:hypothetical protein